MVVYERDRRREKEGTVIVGIREEDGRDYDLLEAQQKVSVSQ